MWCLQCCVSGQCRAVIFAIQLLVRQRLCQRSATRKEGLSKDLAMGTEAALMDRETSDRACLRTCMQIG